MDNLLLQNVEYKIDETPRGVWRRFLYPTGELYEEFTSHRRLLGLPLVHYTRGRCPETGKRKTAKGVIAVGRVAVGVVAVGQMATGFIAIGQLALGVLFGLGQAATGAACLGQLALAAGFGLGQFVTGHVAIGQFAFGHYVLAQLGVGVHVWDTQGTDPAAEQFFRSLII
jgi:hypothetical protein